MKLFPKILPKSSFPPSLCSSQLCYEKLRPRSRKRERGKIFPGMMRTKGASTVVLLSTTTTLFQRYFPSGPIFHCCNCTYGPFSSTTSTMSLLASLYIETQGLRTTWSPHTSTHGTYVHAYWIRNGMRRVFVSRSRFSSGNLEVMDKVHRAYKMREHLCWPVLTHQAKYVVIIFTCGVRTSVSQSEKKNINAQQR